MQIQTEFQAGDWETANVKVILGRSLLLQEKHKRAQQFLESGYADLLTKIDLIPEGIREDRVVRPLDLLLSLAEETGDKAAKSKWRLKRDELIARLKESNAASAVDEE